MKEENKKCKLSVKTGGLNNNYSRKMAIVLGIFALVIVTTAASFAFFTYSRTGTTTSTIISGDIEFSFIEGTSATLPNAFPVADSVGAVDTTGEYSFEVKLASGSNKVQAYYNVILLDNNKENSYDYFNNEQIKFSLVKNNTYVANTSSISGVKLSDIDGFDELSNQGEGIVLANQLIEANNTDEYKLRIWISDDVDYSNTVDNQDEQESTGKYNSYKYSLKVKVTTEAELSAGYNPISIILDPTGGNLTTNNITVNEFGKYSNLPIPTKEGNNFVGWFTENDELVDNGTNYQDIKANKLIAKWNVAKYTLKVNPNGGTYIDRTSNYEYILNYGQIQSINNPTRLGYDFVGWDIKGNNSKIENNVFTMGNQNATLTAKWEKLSYKLTVNPNGGIWNNQGDSQIFTLAYNDTKEIINPTRVGYIFTGWKITGINAELSSQTFKIGTSDASLEATWQIDTYPYITMHYKENVNYNGYTLVEGDTEEKEATFGSVVTPSRKTYTGFTAPGSKSLTISSTIANNVVDYQYTRNKYMLTIDPNGGSYENSTDNVIKELGYEAYINLSIPEKDGYDFIGWTITSGEINDNILKMPSSNVTITANYEIKKYLITFNANGGSLDNNYKEVNAGGTYGDLPTPKRNGYKFLGWYQSETSEEQILSTTTFAANKHQTLYAKWKELVIGRATEVIMKLAETNTNELRIDKHEPTGQQTFDATEYRYYGATPNNYVQFNNELWRIIGVMDVDDGTGKVEKRLKIVRNDNIGSYLWDLSVASVNEGNGVNEWSQADIMTTLNNGPYYNRTSGTCYYSPSTVTCDFSDNSKTPGLTDESKEMIGNAKWYLGAGQDSLARSTSEQFYNYERSNNTGKICSSSVTTYGAICNDKVVRTTSWVGKIGLIYPSDYGYSADMKIYASTKLSSYKSVSSWLKLKNTGGQWTITPNIQEYSASVVNVIQQGGRMDAIYSLNSMAIYPTLYLLTDINIIDGDGTVETPFILSK